MSAQKYIILQVNTSKEIIQSDFDAVSPTMDCDINIQVADGWAITGHYHAQTLQAVTLQKTTCQEE
jgi:hypothetical protein